MHIKSKDILITLILLKRNKVVVGKYTKIYQKQNNILIIYQKYSKILENKLLSVSATFRQRGAATHRRGARLFAWKARRQPLRPAPHR